MEQHNNQITTSWSLLVETKENSFQSLKEENQTLREQVAQLQQSENQLQEDLKREMKKRRARSKAYLDCMNLLTVENFKLEVCEARWTAKLKDLDVSMEKDMAVRENVWRRRVKELERERQVDKERLQKMEEKRRRTETRANELICKLQNQIQDLNQPPLVEGGGACDRCQSVLEQKVDELERAESRCKNKLSELNTSTQRGLALRDDVWGRRVKELQQETRRDTEDTWKTAERREINLICELERQVQKEERDRQKDSERQEKRRDWWMNENHLTYQLWAPRPPTSSPLYSPLILPTSCPVPSTITI